jgi:lipoprotein-anchoring transpeptidase ErfK/SrfK
MQILLDRAGFSPGEIDGVPGANTERALRALRTSRNLPTNAAGPAGLTPAGDPTLETSEMPTLVAYTITEADTQGPFTPDIPDTLARQAGLDALEYRDVAEALGERFHTSPELLRRLNPDTPLVAGSTIRVPNVDPFLPTARGAERKGVDADPAQPQAPQRRVETGSASATSDGAEPVEVTVSKRLSTLVVRRAGRIVMHAPVTTGSEHDPLPIGDWTVTSVAHHPPFHYNPDLFWDAAPADTEATIPPGPNNPVGVVWIDLSKEHYGIHGTPDPGTVGHTASHGCVRLTNWDAVRLATLVRPGTIVHFIE